MVIPTANRTDSNRIRLRVVVGLLLAVLFCTFCLSVGGLFTFASVLQIRRVFYPSTLAKVTEAGDIWQATAKPFVRLVSYQYEVASQPHYGQDFPCAASKEALSKFTRGESVRIRYNPRQPEDSFIEPVVFPWSWLALASVFLGAGTYGFYRISKRKGLSIRSRQQSLGGAAATHPRRSV